MPPKACEPTNKNQTKTNKKTRPGPDRTGPVFEIKEPDRILRTRSFPGLDRTGPAQNICVVVRGCCKVIKWASKVGHEVAQSSGGEVADGVRRLCRVIKMLVRHDEFLDAFLWKPIVVNRALNKRLITRLLRGWSPVEDSHSTN